MSDSTDNFLAEVVVTTQKSGGELLGNPEHIVKYQYLSAHITAGSDADSWNMDGFGYFFS